MALNTTTAAAAFGLNDLVLSVTSSTGFAAGNVVKVDDEYMLVDRSYVSGTNIPVFRRGDRSSAQVAHNTLAPVMNCLTSDLAGYAAGTLLQDSSSPLGLDMVGYGANGAIAIPTRDTLIVLNKATALASTTLAAPGKDQDGLRLIFTSTTAAAHVITATTLLADGATGSPHTTATFAAFKGAGFTLCALQGLWQVVANNNVTIS